MNFHIPTKLSKVLSIDARIKVIYGGRGGGKTVSLSDILIVKLMQKKRKAFCLREFMNAISDSVHSTLANRIDASGATGVEVQKTEIHFSNGSSVIYGQLARNIESIKSKDSIDIAWVEEAETVKDDSIGILEPSIRATGSEIWYSLNPKSADGAVYKKYIAPHLEAIKRDGFYYEADFGGLLVIKINLEDNPFAPAELLNDSARLKVSDYKMWMHRYGGEILLEDGDNNLIKADDVLEATKQKMTPEKQPRPLIIGVDPARFGKDATSIIRRQGRVAYKLEKYHKQDTMAVAGRVVAIIQAEKPDKVFIDVGGLGAGIYDRIKELGFDDVVSAVNFGGVPINDSIYYNKRSEMWGLLSEWIKGKPVCIPEDQGLIADLVTPSYSYKSSGKLILESKDDMKKRLGRSPDSGDALALTFAYPVYPLNQLQSLQQQYGSKKDYDPYAYC